MAPARLGKKEESNSSVMGRIETRIDEWALNHAHILLPISIIIALCLFIALCYAIVGVSATESGMLRNYLIRDV